MKNIPVSTAVDGRLPIACIHFPRRGFIEDENGAFTVPDFVDASPVACWSSLSSIIYFEKSSR